MQVHAMVITLINHNIILQVAALAQPALLLMPETRYAHLVMKSVTHDQALQWEQWCPCQRWKATGLCWMCTGRQLYSGVEACC